MGALRFAVWCLCVTVLMTGNSRASDLKCPESASVKQRLEAGPSGWEVVGGSDEVKLDRVGFYLRHPREAGSLVPDATQKVQGEERVIWNFQRNPGDQFWIGCIYRDTTIMLAQKLDPKISRCEVRYELLTSGSRLRVKGVACK